MVLDEPEKYKRVLAPSPDLETTPITDEERRFVNLLLLHMTSAYYFSKSSRMVRIEKLRVDIHDVMSLPIPRAVWCELRHYFNKDFVALIDARQKKSFWRRLWRAG